MACECEQITCGNCNPPCTPSIEPIEAVCDTPIYTNNGCYPEQHTDCVLVDNTTDSCIPITNGSNLTTALNNIKAYIKNTFNRITPTDNSIAIIPTDDACDDKVNIKVNISEHKDHLPLIQ